MQKLPDGGGGGGGGGMYECVWAWVSVDAIEMVIHSSSQARIDSFFFPSVTSGKAMDLAWVEQVPRLCSLKTTFEVMYYSNNGLLKNVYK